MMLLCHAKVLAYLLRPENGTYVQTSLTEGRRRTTREFLELVEEQKPEIRVVLDVGAQVLELQNKEFVELWLKLKPDASAAIYFNDDDELTVLSRGGATQSFSESLTDIKFPIGFRAAVTLGPKVTKDRLTQDAKNLEELYAPSSSTPQPTPSIPAIEQCCEELGVSSSSNLNMNEEQEREIVHEIERKTQVE
ncbi:hypothetical protein BKA82DRAFT_20050 [Pisolithus tinctorius]|uniref:Uncharacterized protein n=1 Tax=Pisolithus tinctorius Marx 270 TaxID=870435 RepID=A0A0C3PU05_PISTI|nr:hypothetical protein BKA82DRAFT_20050 [Pisolithus tinctorius]KIO12219.1 hypothetical protein M404DRAFT_20050 [Pisolithus tinctorius Marx 270]